LATTWTARGEEALPERQAGDDALELVVALWIRPEDGGDVDAVQRHDDVVQRDLVRHGHLDPRVAARHVLRGTRDHT